VLLRTLRRLLQDAGFAHVKVKVNNPFPITRQLSVELVQAGIVTVAEYRENLGLPPLGIPPLNAEQ
jgi:hypothetical protein